MDYFKQRREYRKLKRDQIDISTGQNNLYRELLDYANDEGLLDKLFTLKNSALIDLTGLSEGGLKKARNELVQMDLIEYVPGKRNKQKPSYRIKQLYGASWGTTSNKSVPASDPRSNPTGNPTSDQTGSSKVLTSTKDYNSTKTHDDGLGKLMTYYQQNFGVTSPLIVDDLQYRIKDFDDNLDVIIEAMRRAAVDQKPYSYAKAIMTNWAKTNIKTMDQVKAADIVFEKQKAARVAKYSQNSGSKKQGVVPSWMDNKPVEQQVSDQADSDLADNFAWLKEQRNARKNMGVK